MWQFVSMKDFQMDHKPQEFLSYLFHNLHVKISPTQTNKQKNIKAHSVKKGTPALECASADTLVLPCSALFLFVQWYKVTMIL